jgi:hypothetical protein
MKQPVVEWLEDKLNQIKSSSTNMNGTIKFLETEFKELFEQAKEMEKHQTDDAYNKGFNQGYRNPNRNND